MRKARTQSEEIDSIRGILNEAQMLYRNKVEKLESDFSAMESEKQEIIENRETALSTLNYELKELTNQEREAILCKEAFHQSLQSALDELRALKQASYLHEESKKSVPKDLPSQHRQLREQFAEKSMILDQTRRRLFVIEGHLHALKHQIALDQLEGKKDEDALMHMVAKLLEENTHLEKEIASLEEVISQNLKPSKSKKTKKQLQEMLELQFDTSSPKASD